MVYCEMVIVKRERVAQGGREESEKDNRREVKLAPLQASDQVRSSPRGQLTAPGD